MPDTAKIYQKGTETAAQTPAFVQSGGGNTLITRGSAPAGNFVAYARGEFASPTKIGNLVVAILSVRDNGTLTTPAGWTLVASLVDTTTTPDQQSFVLCRMVDVPATTYTIQLPSNSTNAAVIALGEFSGLAGLGGIGSQNSGSTDPSPVTPSETYSMGLAYLVASTAVTNVDAGWNLMKTQADAAANPVIHSVYKLNGNSSAVYDHGSFGGTIWTEHLTGHAWFTRSLGEGVTTTLRTVSAGETENLLDIRITNGGPTAARGFVLVNDIPVFAAEVPAQGSVQETGFIPIEAGGTLKWVPFSTDLAVTCGVVRTS